MKQSLALLGALLLFPGASLAINSGQPPEVSNSERFEQARQLAFDGHRDQAIAQCQEILRTDPDDREAKVLLGRIYAWNKDYDRARPLLEEVVEERPTDTDARSALVDVELWSDHPEEASKLAKEGLALSPGNASLLAQNARALRKLGMDEEALETAAEALAADPDAPELLNFYRLVLQSTQRNKISAGYGTEFFNRGTDPWYTGYVSYRREFYWGSITPRVNFARRFDKNGIQFEIDSYPTITDDTYGYLNVGGSTSSIFPKVRYGAEVYHNFPKGWEASVGFRRLHFDSKAVTIFTGTIAKYFGRYWIQIRPQYVTKNDGHSFSGRIRIRRFFNGRYEYVELSGGAGSGLGSDIANDEADLDSTSVQLSYHRRVTDSLIVKTAIGVGREKIPRRGNRDSIFFRVGFDQLF